MPKTITFTDDEMKTLEKMGNDAWFYRVPVGGCRGCRDCRDAREPGRFDDVNKRCVDHEADRYQANRYIDLAEKIGNA